jgi:hypothetical protein
LQLLELCLTGWPRDTHSKNPRFSSDGKPIDSHSGRESRPGKFHPEALVEPDRTLSRHQAPIMEPRYVPTASEQQLWTTTRDARDPVPSFLEVGA